MHLSEVLLAELAAFSKRTKRKALNIIETGTIRGEGEEYRKNDGWSTVTFAEYTKKNGGAVTSIDLNTKTSAKVLGDKSLARHVDLIEGHSIDVLARTLAKDEPGLFDVAFLDSDNDGALIFHEYLIVKQIMRSPGLIIVDDVDIESSEVVKGHELLPWAQAHGIPHRIIERSGDGYRTGMLVFDV
jgi:predicted O-methyltransferase YrrM